MRSPDDPYPAPRVAGDSALRAGVHYEQIARAIASGPTSGIARCRAALPLLDARSRSRAESHLRVAISTRDLPRFEVNAAIYRTEGGWLAEPDLSLEAARVALEYQGADHAEVGRMRRDITRAGDMHREGWLVLMYGPAETFKRPWQIAGDVRAALRDRAPHLLRPRNGAQR